MLEGKVGLTVNENVATLSYSLQELVVTKMRREFVHVQLLYYFWWEF